MLNCLDECRPGVLEGPENRLQKKVPDVFTIKFAVKNLPLRFLERPGGFIALYKHHSYSLNFIMKGKVTSILSSKNGVQKLPPPKLNPSTKKDKYLVSDFSIPSQFTDHNIYHNKLQRAKEFFPTILLTI